MSANEELAQELHKSVNKRLNRRKVYARFNDKTWPADLAQMDLDLLLIVALNIYYV